MLYYINYIIKK